MNKTFFYPKLAWTNLRKNSQTYVPYILTCIGTIMMFYIMGSLASNNTIEGMFGGSSLKVILNLGTIVIGIFSVIFLFYTNSFLVKRRKKEFGLFNVLGMEKRHISRVMFFETLYVAVISLVVGLLAGILLSKVMYLLLLKILQFDVQMGFDIPTSAIVATVILFVSIFFLTLLNSLRHIHLSNPVELLKGGQVGEREPKTKWILVLIGILSLGGGYYIAITTKSPLDALMLFFVAVVLVMIGTYCLFTAGIIAILKVMKKNKNYYYKTKNFTSVSGMMYRMKQNAVGLANICLLSTAILVMISTTVSLYIGIEDVMRTRYPRNVMISASPADSAVVEEIEEIVKRKLSEFDLEEVNAVSYMSASLTVRQEGNKFLSDSDYLVNGMSVLSFIPLDEYNRMQNESRTLAENEVLVYTLHGNKLGETINIGDIQFMLKEELDSLNIDGKDTAILVNQYYLIVKDKYVIDYISRSFTGETKSLQYYMGFDVDTDYETQKALTLSMREDVRALPYRANVEGAEISRQDFLSTYGGLLFMGIFLGLLFIMATVLIMYYKQISEGMDDKRRFEIMQKVGMDKQEVKRTIKSQVLIVFFLPLVTAVIHIAFAFPVITKLLFLLNLTNVTLFLYCTIGVIIVFAIFYAIVYSLTSRVYYKIVSQ